MILDFLEKYHNIKMSKHLNPLKQYGLTQRNREINEAVLRESTSERNSKQLEACLSTEQCGGNYM